MLICPHCETTLSERARVCAGCGAEIVHGLSRSGRRLVGVICVALALLIGVVIVRALEIAQGRQLLSSPKADDGLLVFGAIIIFLMIPYFIGSRAARLLWRSRVRFYRQYRHS